MEVWILAALLVYTEFSFCCSQCQPTSREYKPSNFFLDFTGILVKMQYVFYEFILCFIWIFCVLLHMRWWWANCEPGAIGSELLPHLRASLLSIYLDLWRLHMGLATCLCAKLQCVTDTSRVCGSSQPAFASLPTLEVGQMEFSLLGHTWAIVHLNWYKLSAPQCCNSQPG